MSYNKVGFCTQKYKKIEYEKSYPRNHKCIFDIFIY